MKDLYTDELIELREKARLDKNYKLSDEIRNILDERLCFIFDTKEGQEVYHLPYSYFKFKDKFEHTKIMSNRQFVEYRIKKDILADKYLESWIYTNLK